MKKFLKLLAIFILPIFIINIFTTTTHCKSDENEAYLSLDFEDKNELPLNFRTSLDLKKIHANVDTSGLDTLNISGSAEFTSLSLQKIKDTLNWSAPIYIVDLRQESHGFINGNAISLFSKGNKVNAGLPLNTVIKREDLFLQSIPLNRPIYLDIDKYKLTPKIIENEKALTENNDLNYFRIAVTDNERPTDDSVNRFLNFVTSLSKDSWIHFHCKAGDGRTTTFMILFDIINNYKNVSFDSIVARQSSLGSINLLNFEKNDIRYIFLENFYKYANDTNFNILWTEWVKSNNIEPFTLMDENK